MKTEIVLVLVYLLLSSCGSDPKDDSRLEDFRLRLEKAEKKHNDFVGAVKGAFEHYQKQVISDLLQSLNDELEKKKKEEEKNENK